MKKNTIRLCSLLCVSSLLLLGACSSAPETVEEPLGQGVFEMVDPTNTPPLPDTEVPESTTPEVEPEATPEPTPELTERELIEQRLDATLGNPAWSETGEVSLLVTTKCSSGAFDTIRNDILEWNSEQALNVSDTKFVVNDEETLVPLDEYIVKTGENEYTCHVCFNGGDSPEITSEVIDFNPYDMSGFLSSINYKSFPELTYESDEKKTIISTLSYAESLDLLEWDILQFSEGFDEYDEAYAAADKEFNVQVKFIYENADSTALSAIEFSIPNLESINNYTITYKFLNMGGEREIQTPNWINDKVIEN